MRHETGVVPGTGTVAVLYRVQNEPQNRRKQKAERESKSNFKFHNFLSYVRMSCTMYIHIIIYIIYLQFSVRPTSQPPISNQMRAAFDLSLQISQP
jgi:hypothetical protein